MAGVYVLARREAYGFTPEASLPRRQTMLIVGTGPNYTFQAETSADDAEHSERSSFSFTGGAPAGATFLSIDETCPGPMMRKQDYTSFGGSLNLYEDVPGGPPGSKIILGFEKR